MPAKELQDQRIHGKSVGSTNELNVALALDKLDIDYKYQYQFGLPGVRGSQKIDFLAYTLPKPTPIFVHGEYWHTGKMATEDELKMIEIVSQMHNQWFEPVIIWGKDSETIDQAFNMLRKLLMI